MLKTKLQTFKAAMKAPQYEKLSMYELKIYQAGFKNGFKLAQIITNIKGITRIYLESSFKNLNCSSVI